MNKKRLLVTVGGVVVVAAIVVALVVPSDIQRGIAGLLGFFVIPAVCIAWIIRDLIKARQGRGNSHL